MDPIAQLDTRLISRYNTSGPRYTSYPTALEMHDGFGEPEYREQIALSNARGGPLSLYFHIPFCDTVCFYCACNKIVTKNRKHAESYLDNLCREIVLQGALFERSRKVNQLHWGGGTPTFLDVSQMLRLMETTRKHFNLHDDDQGDYSIEVDPRECNRQTIAHLHQLGMNRISLGLQDFDEKVQKAVNRMQSREQTFSVLEAARREGFRSINVDLIYGLPLQTVASFASTLDRVLEYRPNRFSIFNYAHLPDRFKTQRQINDADLPDAQAKLAILQMVRQKMADAGYFYIGMDHFALPDDELLAAQREGRLYRNFQGYSTHSDCDLVGFGITAIGRVGDAYIQNVKDLDQYEALLAQDKLPASKGLVLNEDDKIRGLVISQLICNFRLPFSLVEQRFNIDFKHYFASELIELGWMENDKLLRIGKDGLQVLSAGRLLIRNICMVFDNYLHNQAKTFSRVI